MYRVRAARFPSAYPIATPIGLFGSTCARCSSSQANRASSTGRARACRAASRPASSSGLTSASMSYSRRMRARASCARAGSLARASWNFRRAWAQHPTSVGRGGGRSNSGSYCLQGVGLDVPGVVRPATPAARRRSRSG